MIGTKLGFQRAYKKALRELGLKSKPLSKPRAFIRVNGYGRCFCPITLVARHRTGRNFSNVEYPSAAVAAGIDLDLVGFIVSAADSHYDYEYDPELREWFEGLA